MLCWVSLKNWGSIRWENELRLLVILFLYIIYVSWNSIKLFHWKKLLLQQNINKKRYRTFCRMLKTKKNKQFVSFFIPSSWISSTSFPEQQQQQQAALHTWATLEPGHHNASLEDTPGQAAETQTHSQFLAVALRSTPSALELPESCHASNSNFICECENYE